MSNLTKSQGNSDDLPFQPIRLAHIKYFDMS